MINTKAGAQKFWPKDMVHKKNFWLSSHTPGYSLISSWK